MPTFILPPPLSLSLSLSLTHISASTRIPNQLSSILRHLKTSRFIGLIHGCQFRETRSFLSPSPSPLPPSLPAGPPGWFSEKAGRCRSSQKPELICIIFAQRHLAHEMINSTISQNGMASISLGLTQHLGQCAVAPLILVIFSLNTSSF